MAKTVKEAKADIFLRDTDSQSLFNNSGVLSFKYYHEWNDCYNQVTGETAQIAGEVYDETTNSYKPNCPEGFSPVFNGRLSALWDNIVNCFPNEVEAMYAKMRGNGLTYQDMLTKYKDFWKYWCENLYNADAFGYANTNNFTKAYGDKVQVMDYFYGKRQRYLDSKYHCGSSVGNNLRLRLYEVGRGFAIKHYQAIYCTLQWGVGNFDDHRNIKPGTYSYMPFKFSNPQDATFDIDDADLITELSTYAKGSNGNYTIYGLEGLGDFKFDLNMGLLKRLTKFVMNYTASKPNTRETGTSFDLSNMGMLRQVIVRNVKNLKKSIILSSDLLEEIDFTNTPITGVTTPPTDMLTKLVLPDTIKELNLVGYTNLEVSGFQVAGYSNIDTLHIEDCPNLDSYSICKTCYDAGAKLSDVTIKNVDWSLSNIDLLLYLANKGAKLQGKINIDNSVSITATQKQAMLSAWGNIDNKSNSLYISYKVSVLSRISISGRSYFNEIGTYDYVLNTVPTGGNNIRSIVWSISDNKFASIDKSTGKCKVTKLGDKESDDKATIGVIVTLIDDTVLEASKEIHFYKKDAALGDYVFSDGTYGTNFNDSSNSPVAVIFYLSPDRKHALAISLSDYFTIYANWGLYHEVENNQGFSSITLEDNSIYNVFDIHTIENFQKTIQLTDSNMRDEYNTKNDGFKEYSELNTLSDLGFDEITSDMWNTNVGHTILGTYIKNVGLSIGDSIARGQLNTLKIIAHRDYILQDANVNCPIPNADDRYTLAESITNGIQYIMSKNNNKKKYAQYYYPAASYCNAYVPVISKSSKLAECLGEGHWFLFSIGELARIAWYAKKGYTVGAENNIFAQAVKDNVFHKMANSFYLSSSEYSEISAHALNFGEYVFSANTTWGYKVNSYNIRPIVALEL
jgi:hypothetical protein